MKPNVMHAMVLEWAHTSPHLLEITCAIACSNQVLIKVIACGVCRTDLQI